MVLSSKKFIPAEFRACSSTWYVSTNFLQINADIRAVVVWYGTTIPMLAAKETSRGWLQSNANIICCLFIPIFRILNSMHVRLHM